MENYIKSGHGRTVCDAAEGPTCVTCHGSHNIQQASMDIINEQLCSRCHTYERAKEMKQALFMVESKLNTINMDLQRLRLLGISTGNMEKAYFRRTRGSACIRRRCSASRARESNACRSAWKSRVKHLPGRTMNSGRSKWTGILSARLLPQSTHRACRPT